MKRAIKRVKMGVSLKKGPIPYPVGDDCGEERGDEVARAVERPLENPQEEIARLHRMIQRYEERMSEALGRADDAETLLKMVMDVKLSAAGLNPHELWGAVMELKRTGAPASHFVDTACRWAMGMVFRNERLALYPSLGNRPPVRGEVISKAMAAGGREVAGTISALVRSLRDELDRTQAAAHEHGAEEVELRVGRLCTAVGTLSDIIDRYAFR